MGFKDKFNNFFALDEEEMGYFEEETNSASTPPFSKEKQVPKKSYTQEKTFQPKGHASDDEKMSTSNIVSINQQSGNKPRIKVVEPRVYSEVQEIADLLLNNHSIVLNFRRCEEEQAKKMIDFLMGTVYAVKGDIQRIGEEIFLCTPPSVEIDGADFSAFTQQDLY